MCGAGLLPPPPRDWAAVVESPARIKAGGLESVGAVVMRWARAARGRR